MAGEISRSERTAGCETEGKRPKNASYWGANLFRPNRLAVSVESPFEILSIGPDADEAEVERAFRRRVKEAHPDQGGSAREFRLVKAAYEEIKSADGNEEIEVSRESVEEQREQEGSRIEYLNFEVLGDYGWELDDDDLFEKASAENLDSTDYGRFLAEPGESLLEAAENRGFAWPYSCRGGACANCAVVVTEGELSMPVDHILPTEMVERGIQLSCNGVPVTDQMKVVYNVKHLPVLEELRLPPRSFEGAHLND